MRSKRNNWDFLTSLPEALHQLTIDMSDRGIPYSYRHMAAHQPDLSGSGRATLVGTGGRFWRLYDFDVVLPLGKVILARWRPYSRHYPIAEDTTRRSRSASD
jgi:hypothetical protein